MKKGLFYLWIVLLGLNCASSENPKERDTFPDKSEVSKSKKHQRIPGSNLFAIIPNDYEYVKPFRYVKSKNEFIILSKIERPFNYEERKSMFEADDPEAETIDFKEVNFNNQRAIFRESVIVDNNQHFYLLTFGDELYSYMILSQCKLDNAESRNEMLAIVKSICVDPSATYDPLETAIFTIDEDITNFKIAKANINDYRYTQTGDYNDNSIIVNSILVTEIGPTTSPRRIGLMKHWASTYLKSKSLNDTDKFEEVEINGYQVIDYDTDFSLNGVDGKVYFAIVTNKDNISIKFTGIAFDDKENAIQKYKATLQSIKFK